MIYWSRWGRANLERFSLRVNNELNLVAIDPTAALAASILERVFRPDIEQSERIPGVNELIEFHNLIAVDRSKYMKSIQNYGWTISGSS